MAVFQLDIVTPEKALYSGSVERLQAPGSEGSFGVLAGHAPMVASLAVGALRFVEESGAIRRLAISGGFVEVQRDRVNVLAETAEMAEEIDVERALAARDRARERFEDKGEEMDRARAQAALARALNRLKVAGPN